jgi:methanogenic corrinoid protein MtbC1
MQRMLTPKQVSRALQVSESSVKRWCDKGVIATQYTAGGHRRITMAGLADFLRSTRREVAIPEAVGLPATIGKTSQVIERAGAQLTEALIAGDEQTCQRIALDLYLAEYRLSTICDRALARAFEEIGDRWQCGQAEVYQERRGCEIALRVLYELGSLLPPPPPEAPLAIGGAVAGDQYHLGTTMAELVLRDQRWNAVSLGDNLPFDTLGAAIAAQRPTLFWLSCSHLADEQSFLSGYRDLYDAHGSEVAFVVGGRALTPHLREQMKYAAYCDNMQHLETFAHSLRNAGKPRG